MEYSPIIQNMQLSHLQAQLKHLSLVSNYHLWMMNEVTDPELRNFHLAIANQLRAVLEDLERLIEIIQLSSQEVPFK
jgi:hypothetical protein